MNDKSENNIRSTEIARLRKFLSWAHMRLADSQEHEQIVLLEELIEQANEDIKKLENPLL